MSLIIPGCQLIDDGIEQFLLHPEIRSLLRIFVGRTEGAGRITAVDRFNIDYHRLWYSFRLQKKIYISLL